MFYESKKIDNNIACVINNIIIKNNRMNLRTFDKYHYIDFNSFESNIAKPQINYHNIGLGLPDNNTFIVIENLLTNDECQEILEKTENFYGNLKMEYLETDRKAERLLNMNDKMAKVLFNRLQHIVDAECKNKCLKPYGFGIEGVWKPCEINSCFRHSKYESPSIGFTFHRDSCYVEDVNMRSVLSLVIYLNDDFEGGATLFVKPTTKRMVGQTVAEELQGGYQFLQNFQPKKGWAILFNHDVIHSGMLVTKGVKYIVRSDVIFVNTTPTNNYDYQYDTFFLQAVEYYREANNQEMKGNVKKASELYERGLSLRQYH